MSIPTALSSLHRLPRLPIACQGFLSPEPSWKREGLGLPSMQLGLPGRSRVDTNGQWTWRGQQKTDVPSKPKPRSLPLATLHPLAQPSLPHLSSSLSSD